MRKQFRAIVHFYKNFYLITLLSSVGNAYLVYRFGVAEFLSIILLTKTISNVLIWYFYQIFWAEEFYFYSNLRLGQNRLWTGAFGIDFLLMVLLFTLITYLK